MDFSEHVQDHLQHAVTSGDPRGRRSSLGRVTSPDGMAEIAEAEYEDRRDLTATHFGPKQKRQAAVANYGASPPLPRALVPKRKSELAGLRVREAMNKAQQNRFAKEESRRVSITVERMQTQLQSGLQAKTEMRNYDDGAFKRPKEAFISDLPAQVYQQEGFPHSAVEN